MAIRIIPALGTYVPALMDGVVTESQYIKAGYIVVQSVAERDALLNKETYHQRDILVAGSPVYVASEGKTYRWNTTSNTFVQDIVPGYTAVNTLAERDALANKTDGLHCYVIETETVYVWKASLNVWAQDPGHIDVEQIAGEGLSVDEDGKLYVLSTNEVTKDSDTLITSGGVYTEIENTVGEIYTNMKKI